VLIRIWYIFPQLAGLATSTKSKRYAISSLEEAQAYLAHPVLGTRLAEITQAVLDSKTKTALALMGTPDFIKLHACMTLFMRADPKQEVFSFQAVLDKYYKGVPQALTDDIINIQNKTSIKADLSAGQSKSATKTKDASFKEGKDEDPTLESNPETETGFVTTEQIGERIYSMGG